MQWVINNVEWIFSGIGVFILSCAVSIFFKSKGNDQSIKSWENSKNNQAGRDMTITSQKEGESNEK